MTMDSTRRLPACAETSRLLSLSRLDAPGAISAAVG